MKKVIVLLAISALVLSCKEEKNDTDQIPEAEAEETTIGVQRETVDYDAFGIKKPNLPKGLNKGNKAPDVMLTMQDGTRMSLEGLYSEQPVVLFFYRGYWCPVCIKHLSEFAKEAKKIEDKGVKLVAVTPETYDNVGKTKEKTGANFTIVSDGDGSVMQAFDVDFDVTQNYQGMIQDKLDASIAESNATGEAVLPVPATFIINTKGEIVYTQFNPDYKDRASIQEIIDNLPETKEK
ncbi:hypothetical protein GCM10007424_07650 [Flavobacterium suaedae]|uniref:thioredoxin-dependent peroxiredoxin n=1 Tax=Flavobacterium suaedae TaxID=1767027 RepID=A0ABQ1JJW5_9FLAO|nr:peroxiredoxin-like family protein [Flavobacterium suaedae]GGB70158.1 hypothetical protein GCM10007424_07650 [Flavobacterium suaedae]